MENAPPVPFPAHGYLLDPDRLPVALMALLVTAIAGMLTGPWAGNAMPLYWGFLDRFWGGLGTKLDKRQRKVSDLVFRGFVLTALVLAFSCAALFGALWLIREYPFMRIPEILCLSALVTSGAVWQALVRLYRAIQDKKPAPGVYYAISRSTRTDFSGADDYALTRAGMGLAARAFDKGMVAPVFWYLIFGLPGAFVQAALAMVVWRFGKDGFGKGFASLAVALEKLAGFVPSLLAGLIVALAGLFTPTGGMTRAFAGMLKHKAVARYEEGGLPLTAMAYALNVSLGGPGVDLEGSALQRSWAGPKDATARLEAVLRRALYIILMAHLLFAAGLGALLLYGGALFLIKASGSKDR